jgi:4a-hydroxytetrahydrobiopterin dehydratase
MIAPLTDEARTEALAALPLWSYDVDRRALHRSLKLRDFPAAFGLMTRIAMAAERADHHPEWFNVYNRVDIWLTTHAAAGVSARDIAMATTIDRLAQGG